VDADEGVMIFGLKVKIANRHGCQRCGYPDIAVIDRSSGAHFADLNCANCGVRCGALSERTAKLIGSIVNKFGAPATPIILRRPAS
jgi:hypothetical protein